MKIRSGFLLASLTFVILLTILIIPVNAFKDVELKKVEIYTTSSFENYEGKVYFSPISRVNCKIWIKNVGDETIESIFPVVVDVKNMIRHRHNLSLFSDDIEFFVLKNGRPKTPEVKDCKEGQITCEVKIGKESISGASFEECKEYEKKGGIVRYKGCVELKPGETLLLDVQGLTHIDEEKDLEFQFTVDILGDENSRNNGMHVTVHIKPDKVVRGPVEGVVNVPDLKKNEYFVMFTKEGDCVEIKGRKMCLLHTSWFDAKIKFEDQEVYFNIFEKYLGKYLGWWKEVNLNDIMVKLQPFSNGIKVQILEKISVESCGNGVCEPEESSFICPEDCGSLCGNGKCDVTDLTICPWDCNLTFECGNGVCENGEYYDTCPEDCPPSCGNGVCDERELTCPFDCEVNCGNGVCTPKEKELGCFDCAACGNKVCELGENVFSCPEDCCGACGDGVCKGYECGESPESCPVDCGKYACGNGICEPGEDPQNCPYDCSLYACGNGVCEPTESIESCPEDCGNNCGNGICEKGESMETCKPDCGWCGDGICSLSELQLGPGVSCKDCKPTCGNGICEGGESATSCPEDCVKCKDCRCGNGVCEGDENEENCPADCADTCGDGRCSIHESVLSCPEDCYNSCGDGICDLKDLKDGCCQDCGYCESPTEEELNLCPNGCQNLPTSIPFPGKNIYLLKYKVYCGNGVCEGGENSKNCYQDCEAICGDGTCGLGETFENCPFDCSKDCGNGVCDPMENPKVCPLDCASYCGDGICDRGERPETCPPDCGKIICGNGVCEPGESHEICPFDCGAVICGDGVCEKGENPEKCPEDCATVCGDGVCNGAENYENCPWDCGYCGDGVCTPKEKGCILDCQSACGNGICEKDETAEKCPYDCTAS